ALPSEGRGREFESRRVRHYFNDLAFNDGWLLVPRKHSGSSRGESAPGRRGNPGIAGDRLSGYPLLLRYRGPPFYPCVGKRSLVIVAALIWCAASMHFWKFVVFADLLGVIVPGWNS